MELKIFRRSSGIRFLSLFCLILFVGLEVYHLTTGGRWTSPGGLLLGALSVFSVAVVLLNMGDRYQIDEQGISYCNPILARMGVRLNRGVKWGDVVSCHVHRTLSHGTRDEHPSALLLTVRSGPKFVIDSVDEIDEIRRLISQRLNDEGVSR